MLPVMVEMQPVVGLTLVIQRPISPLSLLVYKLTTAPTYLKRLKNHPNVSTDLKCLSHMSLQTLRTVDSVRMAVWRLVFACQMGRNQMRDPAGLRSVPKAQKQPRMHRAITPRPTCAEHVT